MQRPGFNSSHFSHPLRASGVCLATSAVNQLHARGGCYALCAIFIGVGEASR